MKRTLTILALAVSGAAFAQMHGHGGGMGGSGGMAPGGMPGMERGSGSMQGMEKEDGGMPMGQPSAELADGEVRKIDWEAGKITLSHGPIPSMGMPAMTMVYRARDPAMLDRVSVGDKVRFGAEKAGDAFTLIRIERAN